MCWTEQIQWQCYPRASERACVTFSPSHFGQGKIIYANHPPWYIAVIVVFSKSRDKCLKVKVITNFHLNTIKRLQALLPNRTATAAVYLLLETIPIIAEIHKRQLSLLFSIATCTNTSIRNVAWRQAALGLLKKTFLLPRLSISYTCTSFLNSEP